MAQAQASFSERDYISITTVARERNTSIPESRAILFSYLKTSEDFQGVFFEFKDNTYIMRRGIPNSPDSLMAIEKIDFSGDVFKLEHDSKPPTPDLAYTAGLIGPLYQQERVFPDGSFENKDHPVQENKQLRRVEESIKNTSIENFAEGAIARQPTLKLECSKAQASQEKKVHILSDQPDNKPKVNRISTPHPTKTRLKELNTLMKNSNLYTVDEDDTIMDVDSSTLKRKICSQNDTNKKVIFTPPFEAIELKKQKVNNSRTFIDNKGRIVTEDYEEFISKEIKAIPSMPNKTGLQTSLARFITN